MKKFQRESQKTIDSQKLQIEQLQSTVEQLKKELSDRHLIVGAWKSTAESKGTGLSSWTSPIIEPLSKYITLTESDSRVNFLIPGLYRIVARRKFSSPSDDSVLQLIVLGTEYAATKPATFSGTCVLDELVLLETDQWISINTHGTSGRTETSLSIELVQRKVS